MDWVWHLNFSCIPTSYPFFIAIDMEQVQTPWEGSNQILCNLHPCCQIWPSWNSQHGFGQQWLSLDQGQVLLIILYTYKNIWQLFRSLLKPGAKPVHCNAHPVLHWHRQILIKNLIKWSILAFLNHVGPLNGHPLLWSSQKRWLCSMNDWIIIT